MSDVAMPEIEVGVHIFAPGKEDKRDNLWTVTYVGRHKTMTKIKAVQGYDTFYAEAEIKFKDHKLPEGWYVVTTDSILGILHHLKED